MNEQFINIKVDREERPDLDHIYQSAHQLLSGRSGGWPLTVFLTPDQEPFFSGTYFPPAPRHGLPAFRDLLTRIDQIWRTQRADITQQNASLLQALADDTQHPAAAVWTPAHDAQLPERACRALLANLDPLNGGFGGAPKFPHPTDLELLLVASTRSQEPALLDAVRLSLRCMGDRGLVDQLGGGFFRYCVDADWNIPHFEKMLYDNGPLLRLCADLWCITGEARLRDLCTATVRWLLHEMTHASGAFHAALDADSEGEEGRFYLWDRDHARRVIGESAWPAAAQRFGFADTPNFEHRFWHLHWHADTQESGSQRAAAANDAALQEARARLLATRATRVRPGLDDKILVAWNGLMIRGLLRAARVFARADWLDAGLRALAFIASRQFVDGRLYAVHAHDGPHLNAYLDDHAFLLDACLEALQARWDAATLTLACRLADALLERFEDRAGGGFHFTSHDHEALLTRPRILTDAAVPSGYAVATRALLELAEWLGETRYAEAATRALAAAAPAMQQQPAAHASLMLALDTALRPPRVVVLRGPAQRLAHWQAALAADYLPDARIIAIPDTVQDLPALLAKPCRAGQVNAWVCQGVECLPEIIDLETLRKVCKSPAQRR